MEGITTNIDVPAESAVNWQDILQLSFNHLDLVECWRLHLTSKAANGFCLERLADGNYQHAEDLLFRAVAAEASVGHLHLPKRHQITAALNWLLKLDVIPPELLARNSSRYLCVSGSSFRQRLLQAGVVITYESLVTAARHLTKDLYMWIEDCKELKLPLEINGNTQLICCSYFPGLAQVYPPFFSSSKIILDHLYLALNNIGSRACNSLVDQCATVQIKWLCGHATAADLSLEEVEALLHAAVKISLTRGHNITAFCGLKAMGAIMAAVQFPSS